MIVTWLPWTRAKAPARPAGSGDPSRWRFLGFAGPQTAVAYQQSVNALAAIAHPSVSRCVQKLATSVQTVDWTIEKPRRAKRVSGRKNSATQDDLQLLLDMPNPVQTGAAFRNLATQYRAATGVLYVLVMRNTRGIPSEMWLLSPSRVDDMVDDKGRLRGHRYNIGGKQIVYPTRDVAFEADAAATVAKGTPTFAPYVHKIEAETLDLSTSHDVRPRPYTPLNSLALPVQIVDLLMQRAVDTASGHPNSRYIVTLDAMLTRAQERDVKENLDNRATGERASGSVLVVEGTNAKVTKLDNDLSDIHSKMPLDDMDRRIAASFGIPPAVLGIGGGSDGAKYAQNYTESRSAFWEDTIEPSYLAPFEEGFTAAICPDGFEVRFDRGSVPALQDAIALRAQRLEANSIMTVAEKRHIAGLPKDLPEGEQLHSPKQPVAEPTAASTKTVPADNRLSALN